ncbi:MAG: hypothetical protein M0Q19_10485 [Candidatus Cloacimonetes bacterium]|jgi:hypothetical protein|nr:hypothetical protein [Candidatus Cloacimonadota bacterium]MDY0386663.1 hypothetical protein [Methanolobus sp.]
MRLKVYRHNYSTGDLKLFEYKGRIVEASFDGGTLSPRRINGSFSTSDPFTQEALESLPDFGTGFFIERDNAADAPAAVVVEDTEQVLGVKNITEAKKYLTERYVTITYSQLKNKPMVLKVMENLNINFPEWLTEDE